MIGFRRLFVPILVLAAACGRTDTVDETGDQASCEGPAAKQLPARPITNGSPSPTLLQLGAGQRLAVGALLSSDFNGNWSNSCTATLVAPKVVLTAAHCVWRRRGATSPDRVRFGVGPDMRSPQRTFQVESVSVQAQYGSARDDASYDVAILVLKEDATAALPELTPIPVNREAIDHGLIGRQAQVVGYGMTSPRDTSNTRQWWTTEEIVQVTSIDVVVDGKGQSAVCYGDSGGPLLHAFEDGSVRVIGVLSWGDPTCLDKDHFGRVDKHVAWMERPDVAGPLPVDGCGDVGPEASCDGNTLRWCDAGRLVTADCAASGLVCGADPSGVAACLPDPCEGLDFQGACEDGVAVWCEGGAIQRFDCGRCGLDCTWVGEALGHFCRAR